MLTFLLYFFLALMIGALITLALHAWDRIQYRRKHTAQAEREAAYLALHTCDRLDQIRRGM